MSFNKAQLQAIAHEKGPCMVLAGPGSGKTTLITKRIEYLIQKYKVKPEEILVITFSKAASKEMRERFHGLNPAQHYPVTFGTFHGIYYGILKWAYNINASNIFTEDEKYQLLYQVIEQLGLALDDEKEFIQDLASEISNVKNNQIPLLEYQAVSCEDTIFRKIYETYENQRKGRRKIDFDDMLVLTHQLFVNRPDVLKMWQKKYKHVLIDEFQDINQVQYDVIRMLVAPEDNLFIVGDDDQSIYRFRGARPEIMLDFPKDYPNAKQIVLDVNYRSTKNIVKCASRLIKQNQNRYEKEIITLNEQGPNVHIQEVLNPIEESKYVVEEIGRAIKQGVPASEIAVLVRTNLEARTLVETCMEYGVPFHMREHIPNLYEHFIAKNFITYMKMALGDRSRKSFLEIMNRPNRYIGRDAVDRGEISFEQLRKYYEEKDWMLDRIDQFELDLRVLGRMAPYGAIQYIRKHMGYDEFLIEYAYKRKIKMEDLREVISEIEERAKEFKTIEDWFAHIEEYSRQLKLQAEVRQENPKAIQLMTMHGAKGLEFDTVFILGGNEKIMPYKRAETVEEIEEERRLFYVAMTRAKKRLVISYTKEKNGKQMSASRFVEEIISPYS